MSVLVKRRRMSGSRAPRYRVEDALEGGDEDGDRGEAEGES